MTGSLRKLLCGCLVALAFVLAACAGNTVEVRAKGEMAVGVGVGSR